MSKKKWKDLSHEDRIKLFKDISNEEIIAKFIAPEDIAAKDFERFLDRERRFWRPDRLGDAIPTGASPNKETLLGAWRDLNKSEALLELIDNSIDAWLRRKAKYPRHTTKNLQIYIEQDADSLTYEDNAGGVKPQNHNNLVNPGNSETSPFDATIGSYRTGGKKAMFKLAEEVSIETRYRDPDGIVDQAYSVHLNKEWLEDPVEYTFLVYPISSPEIDSGHTRYSFKLRDKNWSVDEIEEITAEIRTAYSLLIVRSPDIDIHFNNREEPLEPLEDLYKFSGATNRRVDIRPQRVTFKSRLEYKGEESDVEIEVVLGCRTTTGVTDDDTWGIDLYGNNRLFISHNQEELFKWYQLPTGNSSKLVRGYINIIGPNVFVPWDTHKRHLTTDHQIVSLLKCKAIKDFFQSWRLAYLALSNSSELKETIRNPFGKWHKDGEVQVQYSSKVGIPVSRSLRTPLPANVHKPRVEAVTGKKTKPIVISIKVTKEEFRALRSLHGIGSKLSERQAVEQLAEIIKADIL
ncbi:MAG: hypothetical protein HOP17_10490 [Acidobacteria bacterium]|nr:hypothetical protein [Acidobacteriota bacterium]